MVDRGLDLLDARDVVAGHDQREVGEAAAQRSRRRRSRAGRRSAGRACAPRRGRRGCWPSRRWSRSRPPRRRAAPGRSAGAGRSPRGRCRWRSRSTMAGSRASEIAGMGWKPLSGTTQSSAQSLASVAEPPLPKRMQLAAARAAGSRIAARGVDDPLRLLARPPRSRSALVVPRLHLDRGGDLGEHAAGVLLRLAEERIEEARRAHVVPQLAGARRRRAPSPTACGRGSRHLLVDEGIGRRRAPGRSPPALPGSAKVMRAARPRHAQHRVHLGVARRRPEAHHHVLGRARAPRPTRGGESERSSAGSARLPTITGWTNSTDDVLRVGRGRARARRPAAGRRAGSAPTSPGRPRPAARSRGERTPRRPGCARAAARSTRRDGSAVWPSLSRSAAADRRPACRPPACRRRRRRRGRCAPAPPAPRR